MNNERKEDGSVYSVGSQKNLVPIRSRKTFFKKQTPLSNLTIIILLFLVAALLITVVVLAVLYALTGTMKICDNEECVRVAASLKESMDTSVDPCDDFYHYACGRWPLEHPIPDTSLTNTWFNERSDRVSRKIRELLQTNISASESPPWAVMQAKTLFTSCTDVQAMNELDMSPLFDLLTLLDIPLIPAVLSNKTGNYIQQLANAKRILDIDIFMSLDVVADPKNKSRNIIYVDASNMKSSFPTDKDLEKRLKLIRSRLRKLEEIDEESFTEDEEAELVYMREVIKLVISNGTMDSCVAENNSTVTVKELDDFAEDMYDITSVLYHIVTKHLNHSVSEDSLTDENYMLVDDLQRITDEYVMSTNLSLTPKLIWRPYIESVFMGIIPLDLDKKDKIFVGNLKFLKDSALILAAIDELEIETFIWWVVVDMVAPYCSEKLRNAWKTYINKVTDIEVGESQSLCCASYTTQLMGMAVSWLFIDPTFHSNKARKVLEMLGDIREAFVLLVGKTDWMDQQTKDATLEKSRKMTSEIGFPKWLFDEKELNEYYKGIDLSETRFLDNMVQIVRVVMNNSLSSLHDINLNNETYWVSNPTSVNAYHSFQDNQITVPAGILQFPFYDLGLEALNYGAIGAVLGHELTHGFDNSGRHYDSDGNVRQWWSNETITEYTERTQCFIDHYNTYYEDEIDGYIDGELTLGENIADNGGLREAVIAYEKWKARHGREPLLPGFTQFTHEQLFFLSYAHLWCESYTASSLKWMLEDSHCPGHVRLQAVLRNSKEFSAAWKCPMGSNMNPSNKCHVW